VLLQHSFLFSVLLVFIEQFIVLVHMLVDVVKGDGLLLFHQLFHFLIFGPLFLHLLFLIALLHLLVHRFSCPCYKPEILTLNFFLVLNLYALHLSLLLDPL